MNSSVRLTRLVADEIEGYRLHHRKVTQDSISFSMSHRVKEPVFYFLEISIAIGIATGVKLTEDDRIAVTLGFFGLL